MIAKYTIALLVLTLSGIMIRGGFQKIPHTSAVSFFSHNITENYAATNKVRYFIDSYIQSKKTAEYIELPNSKESNQNPRIGVKGPTFLKTNRPNITLIILEGIPNAVFDSTYKIHIPNLRKIKKSAYSFENMYASGFRTDQGILSLLGGIPAYPYINVMKDVEAIHRQPNLIRAMNKEGYHTSFLYGGDGQFSHLKKHILAQQVDYYMDESNFDINSRSMEWGVPDHILLQESSKYIKNIDKPHFTTILTSSTHQPFDYPNNKPKEKTLQENFIGSVEYLDNAMGQFIDSLTMADKNNLIIITADHGSLYLGHHFNDHKRFNVPFLLLGNAVADSLLGTQNHSYYNTHDLPKTIESLLNIEQGNYPLSTDLTTSDSTSSAYWVTEHTMGWLSPKQSIVSNHDASKIYFQSDGESSVSTESINARQYHKATMQHLYSCIHSNIEK